MLVCVCVHVFKAFYISPGIPSQPRGTKPVSAVSSSCSSNKDK